MTRNIAAIQERLNSFYLAELESLRVSGCFDQAQLKKLSAPFLLNLEAAKAYFDAPLRIMFVGQETKGWFCRLHAVFDHPEKHVPSLLERYETALLGDAGRSHFLRTLRLLEKELADGSRGAVIWNNLFKMDVYRGRKRSRNARNYSAALTAFSTRLFRYELELLDPQVIIFGCSATHDGVLKSLFETPMRKTVRVYEPKQLWHFSYGELHCFRTLHPAVARFRHQTVHERYQTIIQAIKSGEYAAASSSGTEG